MTNREWLLNKMQNMSDEELAKAINTNWTKMCKDRGCTYSGCDKCKADWLEEEHKEPITLSEAERIILENVDKDYKWIARDYEGELYIYSAEPTKANWDWVTTRNVNEFICFNHLFRFITWEDEQAYNIEELLKGE